MDQPVVSIVMGSASDADVADAAVKVFEEWGIEYETAIKSAHRTPDEMIAYAEGLAERGIKIVIALAGGSAHLPGMVASSTEVPVLAVPVKRAHHGDEARKSSIAMPPGVPLAVFGDNAAGNAALFCIRTLATTDRELRDRYVESQSAMASSVTETDKELQKLGWQEWRNTQA